MLSENQKFVSRRFAKLVVIKHCNFLSNSYSLSICKCKILQFKALKLGTYTLIFLQNWGKYKFKSTNLSLELYHL